MKREGRQHGMVRSFRILPAPWDPRPNSRFVNRFDSPPTAGLFMKVPSRPTNHSKFTGKCTRPRCTGCHLHPACKSKDKTKGNNKNKSFDIVLSPRLTSWRAVDGRPSLNYSRLSATGLADHLAYAYEDYDDDKCEARSDYEREHDVYDDGDHFISPAADGSIYESHDGNDNDGEEDAYKDYDDDECEAGIDCERERNVYDDGDQFISPAADESKYESHDGNDNDSDEDDDDKISFCEVGFISNQVEDGWCLVEEIDNP